MSCPGSLLSVSDNLSLPLSVPRSFSLPASLSPPPSLFPLHYLHSLSISLPPLPPSLSPSPPSFPPTLPPTSLSLSLPPPPSFPPSLNGLVPKVFQAQGFLGHNVA